MTHTFILRTHLYFTLYKVKSRKWKRKNHFRNSCNMYTYTKRLKIEWEENSKIWWKSFICIIHTSARNIAEAQIVSEKNDVLNSVESYIKVSPAQLLFCFTVIKIYNWNCISVISVHYHLHSYSSILLWKDCSTIGPRPMRYIAYLKASDHVIFSLHGIYLVMFFTMKCVVYKANLWLFQKSITTFADIIFLIKTELVQNQFLLKWVIYPCHAGKAFGNSRVGNLSTKGISDLKQNVSGHTV